MIRSLTKILRFTALKAIHSVRKFHEYHLSNMLRGDESDPIMDEQEINNDPFVSLVSIGHLRDG